MVKTRYIVKLFLILSTIMLSVIIWVHQPLMYVQSTSKRNVPRYCLSLFFASLIYFHNLTFSYCCFFFFYMTSSTTSEYGKYTLPSDCCRCALSSFLWTAGKGKSWKWNMGQQVLWAEASSSPSSSIIYLILTILNQIKSTNMQKHHNDNHLQSRIYSLLTSVCWSKYNQSLFQSDGIDQVSK